MLNWRMEYNLVKLHIYHGQPYARVDFIPQSDWGKESITGTESGIE